MEKLKQTKPFPTLNNLHTNDEHAIIDFFNNNSKSFGSIKYLGSFIENLKIKNDIGIKANSKFLIVQRKTFSDECPGVVYKKQNGLMPDIFDFNYELLDEFPKKTTKEESSIILNSVETHDCNPKQTCSKCNGSGKCQSCKGVGQHICSTCRGDKKVEQKYGTYKNGKPKMHMVPCRSCTGTGKTMCSPCKGSGKCNVCDGTGKVTCTRCKGSGKYQTYLGFLTSFRSSETSTNYADIEELIKVIPDTKNKTVFDGVLTEWSDKNSIKEDKRKYTLQANKHCAQLIDNFDNLASLGASDRLGRVHTYFETVPYSEIKFDFEKKEYTVYIVGENNIVCYPEIPKKHSYSKGFLSKLFDVFTKKKRQIAFLYLASYMFHADDTVDKDEEKLFEFFFNKVKINPEKRSVLISGLKRKNSVEQITPYIKCVRKDKRALVFAWHCVIQNEQICQKEIEAFDELTSYFGSYGADVESIKNKAVKFKSLTSEQMFEEYFK